MIGRRTMVGGLAAWAVAPASAMPVDRRIGVIVADFARAHRFNGIVGLARGGHRDFVAVYGVADVESGRLITPRTRFALGSATKWLTSVAVLRLVERGRLDLDGPIGRWLPGLGSQPAGQVTLRHLLSNTSGIPDRLGAAVAKDPDLRTATVGSAPMVARFATGALAFSPGTGWEYSALNWTIVHAIVERVTGWPFATVLERLVFAPLRMTGAGLVDTIGGRSADTASAYSSLSPPKLKMAPVPPFVAASGNVFADVDDALRAGHGVFSGRILTARSIATLTAIRWPPEEYALGGRVRIVGGRHWAWEAGKTQGYRALIAHDLSGDRTIAIFNNTGMEQATIAALAEAMAQN